MIRPPLVFVATLIVVGAGVGVSTTQLDRPRSAADAIAASSVAGVTTTDRVCPDPSGVKNRQRSWVMAATASGGGSGDVTVTGLDGKRVVASLRAPGNEGTVTRDGPAKPLIVHGQGDLAAGVDAVQLTRADGGPDRGLSAVRCVAAGTRFDFVGVGTQGADDPVLRLTNPRDIPALVDVTVYGTKGPIPTAALQGMRVPPHQQVSVRLVGVVPGQPVLALTVQARTGRVAAALHASRRDGSRPLGVDWVPPAAAPATSLVVPGLFQAQGRQVAYVANPGSSDATVQVAVVRSDGTFVPTGLDSVVVPAGTARAFDVSKAVDGHPAGLRVTADHPVIAGGSTTLTGATTKMSDVAFTSATPALTAPLDMMWAVDTRAKRQAGLSLVAPTGAATVELRDLTHPGTKPYRLTVAKGTTYVVDPGVQLHRRDGILAVQVRVVGAAPVYAAAYWYEDAPRGRMLADVPLVVQPSVVVVPPVRPDPLADRNR